MSCPTRFLKQCEHWQAYGIVSFAILLFSLFVLSSSSFHGWELIGKAFVVWGVTTCVIWWLWIMKKVYDMANWWLHLHTHLFEASALLKETKDDIKEIKNLSAPGT